jgi:hypothetical protein
LQAVNQVRPDAISNAKVPEARDVIIPKLRQVISLGLLREAASIRAFLQEAEHACACEQ